jgi:uncharacterized protein
MTPLEFAVISGDKATVDSLLAHGASVDAHDKLGMNAMYHAIRKGKWSVVQSLLDHNAKIKDVRFDRDRITPLMIAAHEGSRPVTEHLLALGVDPNARDAGGQTAAEYARANHHDALAALLQRHMTAPATRQTKGSPDTEKGMSTY